MIFLSFVSFFGLTIFWSGAKQRFYFREIYWFINQSGIPYLSIVHIMASVNPLVCNLIITTFVIAPS